MKINKLTPALLAPITTRAEAEAFMRELIRLGLEYHFDDGAHACLFENGNVTKEDAARIERQVGLCYDAWSGSGADMYNDCPIGYLLDFPKYGDALASALQMMEVAEGLEPTSALKQAASEYEISGDASMGSFVTWALQQPAFQP